MLDSRLYSNLLLCSIDEPAGTLMLNAYLSPEDKIMRKLPKGQHVYDLHSNKFRELIFSREIWPALKKAEPYGNFENAENTKPALHAIDENYRTPVIYLHEPISALNQLQNLKTGDYFLLIPTRAMAMEAAQFLAHIAIRVQLAEYCEDIIHQCEKQIPLVAGINPTSPAIDAVAKDITCNLLRPYRTNIRNRLTLEQTETIIRIIRETMLRAYLKPGQNYYLHMEPHLVGCGYCPDYTGKVKDLTDNGIILQQPRRADVVLKYGHVISCLQV